MKNYGLLLVVLLLVAGDCFGQGNRYWIKFTDKYDNLPLLNSPSAFLSQKAIERRTKQGITINESDLPISQNYIDGIAPYITQLNHRIKWFNMVVVQMDQAITLRTDTTAWRDTVYTNDTFSITVYDTIVMHRRAVINEETYSFEIVSSSNPIVVRDTINPHPGPIYVRDTIWLNDVVTGNTFDSIRALYYVDTIAAIQYNPLKSVKNKFEAIGPVDQRISYPSKYGAAYHQINMLNGDLLHQLGFDGKGIIVSVMDDGFPGVNTKSPYAKANILGTWDFVDNEEDVYNQGNHGNAVFSCLASNAVDTIIGTAPGADYYLLATEDNTDEWIMEEYNWAAAAEFADSVGAQIFTTSLGYTKFTGLKGDHTYSEMDGHTTVITQAANKAFGKGILVINSAGNEAGNEWYYISAPADGDSVMAIGAVDSARMIAPFSSRGPTSLGKIKPDVCAQGMAVSLLDRNGRLGIGGGTSFSCPITAGCAASLWSAFPDKSAREIRDAIMISADRFWSPDNNYGYGIPNFYNAYLFLKTDYNGGILRVNDKMVVYPNPMESELNVSLFQEEEGEHTLELYNLLGQKVYTNRFYVRDKTFEMIKMNVGDLAVGEYVLRIDGKKQDARRLVKLK